MEVRATRSKEAFDLPEWRVLLAADPNRHIFATPEWNRVWWEEFGGAKRLLVLSFSDPDPVALVPLMQDGSGDSSRIRFLSDDEGLTDYLGPLVAEPARLPAVTAALLDYLEREVEGWRTFEANYLPVPFGFAERLAECADREGISFDVDQHELSAVLGLPSSFDAYIQSLRAHKRHELRRKLRRFEHAAGGAQVRSSTPVTLEADLELFVSMHRGSEGLKGHFMIPERATFFARVARSFQPLGLLSLDFLELDGKALASTFSFVYEGTWYLYNSAYDHSWGEVAPGLVLVARLIERAIGEGIRRFDFLRGRERYKFDLGSSSVPLNTLSLRRAGPG